jgi:hypothetical protein
MNKHQPFVELELSGEKLDNLVIGLRNKLLHEFWGHISEGSYRDQIKLRLEKNILAAFDPALDETQKT